MAGRDEGIVVSRPPVPLVGSPDGIRYRLVRWFGLVTVATGVGLALAVGSTPATAKPAAAAPSSQSKKPPKSADDGKGDRDSRLKALKDYVKGVDDPQARTLLSDFVKFAEKHPKANCMVDCLFDEFVATNRLGSAPSVASALAKVAKCGYKCVGDKATLDKLKKKVAEYQYDGGERLKREKAVGDAEQRVKDLKKAVNENPNDKSLKAALAQAELDRDQAKEARKRYERARTLDEQAAKYRKYAADADTAKKRKYWEGVAERRQQQANNVRAGRKKNDNGPTDGDGPGGTKKNGSTDGNKTADADADGKRGKFKNRLKGWLGLLSVPMEVAADAKTQYDQKRLAAARLLVDYTNEHPDEVDGLVAFIRAKDAPLDDPTEVAALLREWDRTANPVRSEEQEHGNRRPVVTVRTEEQEHGNRRPADWVAEPDRTGKKPLDPTLARDRQDSVRPDTVGQESPGTVRTEEQEHGNRRPADWVETPDRTGKKPVDPTLARDQLDAPKSTASPSKKAVDPTLARDQQDAPKKKSTSTVRTEEQEHGNRRPAPKKSTASPSKKPVDPTLARDRQDAPKKSTASPSKKPVDPTLARDQQDAPKKKSTKSSDPAGEQKRKAALKKQDMPA